MMVFVPTINYTRVRYVLFEGIRPVEEKFRKSGSQKRQATCSSCNLLQLPIPMIERRWREGKEKKNQDQEEKSWTRNTKEDTRTKRVRIEHLRQYTGYTRATIIPLLVRRRKVSHEKEEYHEAVNFVDEKRKTILPLSNQSSFFPCSPISWSSQKRRCTLLPGNRTRMQTTGLKKK